ncbi:redoxin domain-containing protein [Coralloluteibacterium stylophorae]|uniref:Redoxin domain-containing protein n=1 Tax=Coralloluteibacterium stylophorae TaxID=1776034 RepID=A0A8J7VT81_9GAMM|nr:redoxin domain-containing protein [Coralloluteibacterium stylophorae]MBS7455782.1 redoxin domain-containing protein [Coralloluteibacterium stylophorae]
MIRAIVTLLAACLCAAACSPAAQADPAEPTPASSAPVAPEFVGIERWINSAPLTLRGLRGRVVLVEFWTSSCINCIHVLPHVARWHETYAGHGLVVVGVHTPEYDSERSASALQAAVERFGVAYPVAQDNDYRTWHAYGNRFWPALYLIDQDGHIVYRRVGEGGYAETEARIRQLLSDGPAHPASRE